jgi:acyl homoserine lactone synthase
MSLCDGCARLLPTTQPSLLNEVFPQLLHGAAPPCDPRVVRFGAERLITVSPLGIERLVRRLKIRARRAGPPIELGGQAMFACWIELRDEP